MSLVLILQDRLFRGRSSIVSCSLIFLILSLAVQIGIFVIQDIVAGDRSPLFHKCKIVERLEGEGEVCLQSIVIENSKLFKKYKEVKKKDVTVPKLDP